MVRLEILVRALTRLQKYMGARPIIHLNFTIAWPRFNHCLPGGQHSPFGEGVIWWNLIVSVTVHAATFWSKYIYGTFFQEVLEHTEEQ